MLEESTLPKDLDYVDPELVTSYSTMGYAPDDATAQVHPLHFTTAMAELASSAGADIKTRCKVTSITSSETETPLHAIHYLHRDTNKTHTLENVTDVIIAAGPWTPTVLPRTGIDAVRAHSVVYRADVNPYAIFTQVQLPGDYAPAHRRQEGKKSRHVGVVDPEIYARPFGEVYACGTFCFFSSPCP